METPTDLWLFVEQWRTYLLRRGHAVENCDFVQAVLRSKSGDETSYRWLLFHAEGDEMRFTPADYETIRHHEQLGKQGRDEVYVVVRFAAPIDKVIIVPAASAFASGRIAADKGGIPWDW